MPNFIKFRFVSEFGQTVGLIMPEDTFKEKTVYDLANLFPYSESMKLQKLQYSEPMPSWEDAFNVNLDD